MLNSERTLRKRREFELEVLKKRGVRKPKSLSKVTQEASYHTVDYFQNEGYSISLMCKILDIARSAYYKYKNRIKPSKEKNDELLCALIQEYHATLDGILGYRRMTMFINRLNQKNHLEGYIHRLMIFTGIQSRIRKRKVNRKRSKPDYTKENILSRNFCAVKPKEKWLTDVTEFAIPGESKKLFLSPIMDFYDNSIVE